MNIIENINRVRQEIEASCKICGRDPSTITLVAVTKGRSVDQLLQVIDAGCIDLGENRIQEAVAKQAEMNHNLLGIPIRWHFIGNLQKNKVRQAIGRFTLIHSVNNIELAGDIDRHSGDRKMITPILLQANTSGEASKQGLTADEWLRQAKLLKQLAYVKICGLMTMAPLTEDQTAIRSCFSSLRKLRDRLESELGYRLPELSMGMSNDFRLAIEEGATLLRIGSALFIP